MGALPGGHQKGQGSDLEWVVPNSQWRKLRPREPKGTLPWQGGGLSVAFLMPSVVTCGGIRGPQGTSSSTSVI